eukprot:TRINITY_DN6081_c0_g1_i1.p1 TRINITY_DN6081_c0_g1~~TRINITY_DN6081_c0_g1_i1.p1  ORF type:complete len:418 (-),score=61.01 TRINITY_DN6081_c0_g1_i1:670-1923(-)
MASPQTRHVQSATEAQPLLGGRATKRLSLKVPQPPSAGPSVQTPLSGPQVSDFASPGLRSRRPNQRRIRSDDTAVPVTPFTAKEGKVNSVCTAARYSLKSLAEKLKADGLYVEHFGEAILARHPVATHGSQMAEVFYFQYGVVVWWGPSDNWGRLVILPELRPFEQQSDPSTEVEACTYSHFTPNPCSPIPLAIGPSTDTENEGETENERGEEEESGTEANLPSKPAPHSSMTEVERAARFSQIENDHFYLASADYTIKFAYAHALAQSAKLTAFEDRIEKVIQGARKYPEYLAEHGEVKLTQKEIAMLKGKLFIDRMDVNLHCDILDTPDFFWEHPELEPLYLQGRRYMEISKRVEILNQRLDVVHELFSMLSDELNQKAAAKLEWIVIILIVVEIILGLVSIAMAVFGKAPASAL